MKLLIFRWFVGFFLFFLTLCISQPACGQADSPDNPQYLKGQLLYRSGDYELSVSIFEELSALYPHQPEYLYYTGRCLLAIGSNYAQAATSLTYAATWGHYPDGWFYAGMAHYLAGQYELAKIAFDTFEARAGRSLRRRLNSQTYLDSLTIKNSSLSAAKRVDDKPPAPIIPLPFEPAIKSDIPAVTEIRPAGQVKNAEGLVKVDNFDILIRAFAMQHQADSVQRESKVLYDDVREKEGEATTTASLRKVYLLEHTAAKIQQEADSIFEQFNRSITKNLPMLDETERVSTYRQSNKTAVMLGNDSLLQVPQHQPFTISENERFYTPQKPVPLADFPENTLIYTIQMSVLSNIADVSPFIGIYPLFYEPDNNEIRYRYYAGLFYTFRDASDALNQLKSLGYNDPFVISFYNRHRISLDEAKGVEEATKNSL